MLKKLFCNHTYKYYYKRTVMNKDVAIFEYLFVCTRCGKVKSVTDTDIIRCYEEMKEQVARDKAMGLTVNSNSSLTINARHIPIYLNGAACDRVLEKYRELDLSQLSTSRKASGGSKLLNE